MKYAQRTLKQMLKDADIKQSEIAKELGLCKSMMSYLISGQRRMVTDYAVWIARRLGVTIDDVYLAVNCAKAERENDNAD